MGETLPAAIIIGLVTNPRGELILNPGYPSAEISRNRSSKGRNLWPERLNWLALLIAILG